MNLIKQLIRHEGMEKFPYTDTTGHLTIGVGRNLEQGLSEEEIMLLLENDIDRCEEELDRAFYWYQSLDSVRQDAMINLCFNLGLTRLRGFKKALKSMEEQDYNNAAKEFLDSLWATQVGQRAVEVAEMIKTGEYNV